MGQDRHKYQYDRILIEASRILTPQFSGTTITLTGAMVELLRNITAYIHQECTFVDEYHGTYYLTASVADFDTINAIVASLEEKLMGNENTLFGVYERFYMPLSETKSGDGQFVGLSTAVPADYFYIVENASVANHTRDVGISTIAVVVAPNTHYLVGAPTVARYVPLDYSGQFTLAQGDIVRLVMNGCLDGDNIKCGVWGYKMKVST